MAAGGPVKELCEEATCPICLEYFRDPVMIAECGHNFCRGCLARSWGESAPEASCPQCRGTAHPKNLRPNLQLANFVEIAKKFALQEGKGGVCEKHQEPLRLFCRDEQEPLCMFCGISKEHKDHEVIPLEEASQDYKPVMAARKERVCQKHQEPLKLFCKADEAPICVVCDRSKEHRNHEIIPVEEASQEYKKQSKEEKQATAAKFSQLHKFLEEQEKLLLAQMEEVEREVASQRDQHLAELSEGLSSLESLIREMEEKSQQPASELLQDVRSPVKRYKEKRMFENPLTFPLGLKWRIWDFCEMNHLLEGHMKQFKDTVDSGFQLQEAKLTLDPETAHRLLVLSEDEKSVRCGEKWQYLPDTPERFYTYTAVLGREELTSGCYFWEVLLGSEGEWGVGVARKSVRRKGEVSFNPEEGIWAVGKWSDRYRASIKGQNSPLTLSGELKRVRVCLNYDGGRVAFFDADRAALIYEFSGASFSGETLLPFFWVLKKGYLKLKTVSS
ncbi:E3 ubiquitin-protein ligase TRIM39-like isoform X2 [Eublepharis macularius]|uniref:E3 ubiquitin-protein ligase TRIM39-like isoform X2 n=1 Tax=Eublepharis macularius TaxID=481883 RepID=A0AA97KZP5_EUBMA|nr:E3 ubiquitin-protein ligase TRIM39-like isoform X2 [Eublepharis macularius]